MNPVRTVIHKPITQELLLYKDLGFNMQQEVRAFTTYHNGLSNKLFNKLFISKAFTPQKKTYHLNKKDCKEYSAIWDTGATNSVITSRVARECELVSFQMTQVHTAGGINNSKVYSVNIWLPNRVIIPNVKVTEGKIAGGEEVLIGMDIINRGDFAVSNKDGQTVFTYRFPSVERFDFVKNPPPK